MRLKARGAVWYAVGKIAGEFHRVSTGFRLDLGRKGEAAARRMVPEIELEIRSRLAGWTPPEAAPTFRQYWEQTYEPTYTSRKRAPQRDRQVMAHALPFFGDMRLDAITRSDCQRYVNARRLAPQANPGRKRFTTVAAGTVQRERSFLQAVMQKAVDDGLLERNPWRKVERVAYAVRERLVTDAEQAALLARLSPRFQRFVLFLLGTGVRLDECRGIDPARDIDFEGRLVRVLGKGRKWRTVPIPAELVPVIREQLAADGRLWKQNPQRLREVLARACRAVEPSPAGTRRQYQRKAQTGIPLVTPHALRHTFGWRWLKGGGDLYTLSRILGHESIDVTSKHYAALKTEDIRAKADAVDLGLGLPKGDGKVLSWKGRR